MLTQTVVIMSLLLPSVTIAMQPTPVPRAAHRGNADVCTISAFTSLNLPPFSSDLSSALESWSTSLAKQCEGHWSSHCGHSRIGWCTSTEAVPTSVRPALESFTSGVQTWWSSHERDWASVCPEATQKLPAAEEQHLSLAMGFVYCSYDMSVEAGASTRNDQPISTSTSSGPVPTTTASTRVSNSGPTSTNGTATSTKPAGSGAARNMGLAGVKTLALGLAFLLCITLI